MTAGAVSGSDTAWSAVLAGTGADGTFDIVVQGTDELGHSVSGDLAPGLVIDAIVPTITNVQTNAPLFSEVAPYNSVTVTFNTPKPAQVSATVGGNNAPCSVQSSSTTVTVYSCTYGISSNGTEGSGTKVISDCHGRSRQHVAGERFGAV